jgi:small subunit ribosomal protein S1
MSLVMQNLLADNQLAQLKEGTLIAGIVIEIRPNEVVVDVGAKSEGVIPIAEFSHIDDLQIGANIQVFLEKRENAQGNPVLSFSRAEQKKNWEQIITKYTEGSVVTCHVRSQVKGGLIVFIDGVEAFLPASQIDIQPPSDLNRYIGQTFAVKIVKIHKDRCNIIVSRRDLIEEEIQDNRRKFLTEIKVGDVKSGTVKNITDFGAFIDLNGVVGLVYITDMSWSRISHPSDVVKIGDPVKVIVIEINQEKQRISLGMKQITENPWDKVEQKYPIGTTVKGKVVSFTNFGAFVELEPGVRGLIHLSEFSWTKRYNQPSELLSIGQEIDAAVLSIQKDKENAALKNISLSLRQLESNPWDMVPHNYRVGSRVRGVVRNITPFGAFVELQEGIDGMIHISDMSWTRKVNHANEMFKKGDEIEAIILNVSTEDQRISLGIKQLNEDPWHNIEKIFKVGDIVNGKVSKLASFGAFIELKEGIDGLVHISQLNEEHVAKVKDVLKTGQEVTARVIKIDRDERQIGLSIKAAAYDSKRLQEEIASYDRIKGDQDLTSLGDILDQAALQSRS